MSRAHSGAGTGTVTVVLTLLGWSTVPLLLRGLSESVDFWTNNGWRYGASALFWLPLVVHAWWTRRLPSRIWRDALLPSVANIAGQVAFTAAHHEVGPGMVTFGLRTQLVFVAVGAWFLIPAERGVLRSRQYLGGAILLVAGLLPILLGGEGGRGAPPGGSVPLGVALSVFSAASYGAYGLAVRRNMASYHPITAFAVICQLTALGLVALMLSFGRDHGAYVPQLPPQVLASLAISAFVGIAIGHVFYYISIAKLGVAITSGVLQLQPFLVSAASYFLYSERFTWWQWTGGMVAICGATLMLAAQGRGSRKLAMASTEGSD
jgi:drug/metabolite transporter (DMT)-like permease